MNGTRRTACASVKPWPISAARNMFTTSTLRSGGRSQGAAGCRVATSGNACGWSIAICRTWCATVCRKPCQCSASSSSRLVVRLPISDGDNALEQVLPAMNVFVERHRLHAQLLRQRPHRQALETRTIDLRQGGRDNKLAAEATGPRFRHLLLRAFRHVSTSFR